MRCWTGTVVSRLAIAGVAAMLLGGGSRLAAETPHQPAATGWTEHWKPSEWEIPELRAPRWNLPSVQSVLPGGEDHPPVIRKKDSLFDEMSQTAKESWWKTKAALHPSRLHPGRLFAGDSGAPRERVAKDDSAGFLNSIFGGAERPPQRGERTALIENFMSRPRPRR